MSNLSLIFLNPAEPHAFCVIIGTLYLLMGHNFATLVDLKKNCTINSLVLFIDNYAGIKIQ